MAGQALQRIAGQDCTAERAARLLAEGRVPVMLAGRPGGAEVVADVADDGLILQFLQYEHVCVQHGDAGAEPFEPLTVGRLAPVFVRDEIFVLAAVRLCVKEGLHVPADQAEPFLPASGSGGGPEAPACGEACKEQACKNNRLYNSHADTI